MPGAQACSQLLLVFFVLIGASTAQTTGWQLVWSDEFNGAAGSPPDPTKWNYDLGGGGWGNGELETYTSSTQNVFQDGNGNLVIRAIRDSNGNYTSARLQSGSPVASTHTADNSWQHGMIVARIKQPFGQGVLPAFWMLGENFGSAGWPDCGEVDIMNELSAFHEPGFNYATVYGPVSYNTSLQYSTGSFFMLPFGEQVNTDYHVYAIQWAPYSIAFYVDGQLYYTFTPLKLPVPANEAWVFENPFFVLLNVAVSGPSTLVGTPDPNSPFPNQDMLIDYVRVYQQTPVSATTPVIMPGLVVNAASYLGDLAPGGLATVFGNQLADGTPTIDDRNGFPATAGNVTVSVNGVNAPLIYVSPTQINFQIPWETPTGTSVPIVVTRDTEPSAPEYVTIAAAAAPSVFRHDLLDGIAWVTGTGCETTECEVQAGGVYTLWANSLGPKNTPSQDGVAAVYNGSLIPLEVPGGPASCQLTIGGQPATVLYCGAAPGEIIDQINFIYPSGVSLSGSAASLTINGVTGNFLMPPSSGQ
jgi:uncharacterized protein (TIGR03437 family)